MSLDVQNLSDVKCQKLDWDMLSGDKLKSALGQGGKSVVGTDGQGQSSGKAPFSPSMSDLPKIGTKSHTITPFPRKVSEGVGVQTPLTQEATILALETQKAEGERIDSLEREVAQLQDRIWADGLKEATEKQFHEMEDKISHFIADNNFLMNRLTPLIELEKATLDGQGVIGVLILNVDVDVLKKEVFDYTKELWRKSIGLFQDHMAKLIDKYRSWFEATGEHKVHEENAELHARNAELETKLESIRKELLEQEMSIQKGPQSVNVQESPEGLSNPMHDVGSVHDAKAKGKAATENPLNAMPVATDIVKASQQRGASASASGETLKANNIEYPQEDGDNIIPATTETVKTSLQTMVSASATALRKSLKTNSTEDLQEVGVNMPGATETVKTSLQTMASVSGSALRESLKTQTVNTALQTMPSASASASRESLKTNIIEDL
ncbi:hypothetical protein L7F22_001162 [Adiantum nelumboides]|nr:hypothetical protein [Adiantum nelumboides]